jgi:hypothetical protein
MIEGHIHHDTRGSHGTGHQAFLDGVVHRSAQAIVIGCDDQFSIHSPEAFRQKPFYVLRSTLNVAR